MRHLVFIGFVVGAGVGLWRLWIAFRDHEICIDGETPDLCARIRAAHAIPNDTIYFGEVPRLRGLDDAGRDGGSGKRVPHYAVEV